MDFRVLTARRISRTPIHRTIMPKSGHLRLSYSKGFERFGIQSAWLWPGGYVRTLEIRIAAMFDTALLIASALSVALMVAFADLP